jgi:hypothetical protein
MANNEQGSLNHTNWAVICELARLVEMSKGREANGTGRRVPLSAEEIVEEMRNRIAELKQQGAIPATYTVE